MSSDPHAIIPIPPLQCTDQSETRVIISVGSSETVTNIDGDKPLPRLPPNSDQFMIASTYTSNALTATRTSSTERIHPRRSRPEPRSHRRRQPTPPVQHNTNVEEVGSEVAGMIFSWRVWLGLEILALAGMLTINTYALLKDQAPCDVSTWVFTIASSVVMAIQIVLAVTLFVNLPAPALGTGLRMTWAVHRKFMVSRCTFFVSFAISLVQIALIPAGIAIVKNADTDCFTRPTLTYVYTFYLSLAQCIVLVCISIPICFMPCCFLLFDLPSYHGVSPRAIQRLTTITYVDPLSDQTSNVYSSSSNTTGKPSPEEVEAIAPAASRPSWKTIFASSNRSEDLAVSEITTAQAAEPPSERPQLSQTPRAKKQKKTRNFNNNGGRGKSMGQSSRHATVHETECAICLEPWKNGEVIKQMKCGHSYHQDCLTMWLEEHNHCPYCRHQIQTNALFSRF